MFLLYRPLLCLTTWIQNKLETWTNVTIKSGLGLGLWCLTPLSTILQLYSGAQFLVHGENHRTAASHWQTLSHNSNSVKGNSLHEQFYWWMKSENRCYILIFPPTICFPRKNEYILVFPPERSVYTHFSPGKISIYSSFPLIFRGEIWVYIEVSPSYSILPLCTDRLYKGNNSYKMSTLWRLL
jgi:hypothetical protein